MVLPHGRRIHTTFEAVPDGWEFEHHGLKYQREQDSCAFSNLWAEPGHVGPIWNACLRKGRPLAKQRRFCFYPGAEVTITVPQPRG
jgi:hypothetical protein